MTSVTAGAPPLEAESTGSDSREPNGRIVLIHIATVQLVWLAAIAFGIYSAATG